MAKNKWQSVSYYKKPRFTFIWHLHCCIRCYRDTVYNTKDHFKFKSTRTKQGRKYYFRRYMRTAIPYSAKYQFGKKI